MCKRGHGNPQELVEGKDYFDAEVNHAIVGLMVCFLGDFELVLVLM